MLGSHPRIATPQETDLFSRYLPPLWHEWQHELRQGPEARVAGLTSALTGEEFQALLKQLAEQVYRKILSEKRGADIILEKVPAYCLQIPLIERIFPSAKFIHVIRDGRDVACSLKAASKTWGHLWAPAEIREAAKMWVTYVSTARGARAFEGTYIEVRFEDLLSNCSQQLLKIFGFLNVAVSAAECAQITNANTFDKLKAADGINTQLGWSGEALRRFGKNIREPKGFFRNGQSGSWKFEMSRYDRSAFNQVAGNLLNELGYSDRTWPATSGVTDFLVKSQHAMSRWLRFCSSEFRRLQYLLHRT